MKVTDAELNSVFLAIKTTRRWEITGNSSKNCPNPIQVILCMTTIYPTQLEVSHGPLVLTSIQILPANIFLSDSFIFKIVFAWLSTCIILWYYFKCSDYDVHPEKSSIALINLTFNTFKTLTLGLAQWLNWLVLTCKH